MVCHVPAGFLLLMTFGALDWVVDWKHGVGAKQIQKPVIINRLALKSGIDGHLESPQLGHHWAANTSQR